MTTTTHSRRGALRRTPFVPLLGFALALALSGAGVARPAGEARSTAGLAYNWPVKPFQRAHPVRGNFGDPRTSFEVHSPYGA